MRFKDLIIVTKPGIIFGNVLATAAGWAVGGGRSVQQLLALVVGTSLVIAGACVVNNYLDRKLDVHMTRTAKRITATGILNGRVAALYAGILFAAGLAILLWGTNITVVIIGVLGALLYDTAYTLSKPRTHHATLIGTIPGATPPLAGYVAATGHFDAVAWLLFAAMAAWQMPHFYAIALRRQKEYAKAGVPLLPIVKGQARTVLEMRVYGALFAVLSVWSARFAGLPSWSILLIFALTLYWLVALGAPFSKGYAGRAFGRSLLVLMGWNVVLFIAGLIAN